MAIGDKCRHAQAPYSLPYFFAPAPAPAYKQQQTIEGELRRRLEAQQPLAQERVADNAGAKAKVDDLKASNEVFKQETAAVLKQREDKLSASSSDVSSNDEGDA